MLLYRRKGMSWDYVGDKLYSAIIRMDIPMEDLPFVDGRFDVVTFLKTWQMGKEYERIREKKTKKTSKV